MPNSLATKAMTSSLSWANKIELKTLESKINLNPFESAKEHLSEHIFRFAPFQMTKEETLGIHGPNERISLESYKMAINFYFDFYRHLSDYLDNSNIHHELWDRNVPKQRFIYSSRQYVEQCTAQIQLCGYW